MRYTGNGEGMTLLLLTDAESKEIRTALNDTADAGDPEALAAFNRGIQRGTEKMTEESRANWKARAKKATDG